MVKHSKAQLKKALGSFLANSFIGCSSNDEFKNKLSTLCAELWVDIDDFNYSEDVVTTIIYDYLTSVDCCFVSKETFKELLFTESEEPEVLLSRYFLLDSDSFTEIQDNIFVIEKEESSTKETRIYLYKNPTVGDLCSDTGKCIELVNSTGDVIYFGVVEVVENV